MTWVAGERVQPEADGRFGVAAAGGLGVYVNGLRMCEGVDYRLAGGLVMPIEGTLMEEAICVPGCIVVVDYWRA